MERRRTIRLMTGKGLVSLGRRSGELVGAGWPLRDISEGGLRFALSGDHPELPSPGEGVVVTVELGRVASGSGKKATGRDEEAKPFRLSAVVRRVKKTKKGGRGDCEVSLEFTGLSQEARARLRGTVIDLAMEKIEKGAQDLAPVPRKKRDEGAGDRLGDILVARSSLSRDEMERFVREDFEKDRPLGRQLVSRGVVDERGVAKALAE
ncbi:MAG: PilZ domain-containing protein, partial [Planctomycetota bacterium]